MNERKRLPQRRASETFDLPGYKVTVGYYNNGMPGEVFISARKAGSDMSAIARDAAILLSLAVQYGVPLIVIQGALTREQSGTSSTVIGRVVDKLCQTESI